MNKLFKKNTVKCCKSRYDFHFQKKNNNFLWKYFFMTNKKIIKNSRVRMGLR